jgi:hypothetical protein
MSSASQSELSVNWEVCVERKRVYIVYYYYYYYYITNI